MVDNDEEFKTYKSTNIKINEVHSNISNIDRKINTNIVLLPLILIFEVVIFSAIGAWGIIPTMLLGLFLYRKYRK